MARRSCGAGPCKLAERNDSKACSKPQGDCQREGKMLGFALCGVGLGVRKDDRQKARANRGFEIGAHGKRGKHAETHGSQKKRVQIEKLEFSIHQTKRGKQRLQRLAKRNKGWQCLMPSMQGRKPKKMNFLLAERVPQKGGRAFARRKTC